MAIFNLDCAVADIDTVTYVFVIIAWQVLQLIGLLEKHLGMFTKYTPISHKIL